MKRFRYVRDPLFLLACALYATNRWLIKPHTHIAFFHNWFNDTLLIPCALPPVLLAHALFRLRPRDAWPGFWEITGHLIGWSILFEWIGPHIMRTTGDPWDAVAYFAGGYAALLWWRWDARSPARPNKADFDFVAPHYRWMEPLLAGRKLQRCRSAFIPSIKPPEHVLFLGEGPGRCLCELLTRHPAARFMCIDSSAGMLRAARANLARQGLDASRVEFVHADALDWQPPAAQFDLIVSCFFLDCFRPDQLARLVPR
ncbi:MAG TPA: class I SAM-dependent methyltransferase, partial [Verrucomicrobiae bacterium]|nr:class I SAM-dependent methyltransferase [Verrucomicrobiae bacterium]